MFNQKSNMPCKNILFNRQQMSKMHDSMERLYKFPKANRSITGQTDLATAMGETPQVINNWEARGISQRGANLAQKKFGCDANWLLGKSVHPMHMPIEGTTVRLTDMESQNPWDWPFKTVSAAQYSLLEPEEKQHIETDILLRVKNRGDPLKQTTPAPKATKRSA